MGVDEIFAETFAYALGGISGTCAQVLGLQWNPILPRFQGDWRRANRPRILGLYADDANMAMFRGFVRAAF